eukprot:scaffold279738_cov31-Tisochrysis_lutea.AAC.1
MLEATKASCRKEESSMPSGCTDGHCISCRTGTESTPFVASGWGTSGSTPSGCTAGPPSCRSRVASPGRTRIAALAALAIFAPSPRFTAWLHAIKRSRSAGASCPRDFKQSAAREALRRETCHMAGSVGIGALSTGTNGSVPAPCARRVPRGAEDTHYPVRIRHDHIAESGAPNAASLHDHVVVGGSLGKAAAGDGEDGSSVQPRAVGGQSLDHRMDADLEMRGLRYDRGARGTNGRHCAGMHSSRHARFEAIREGGPSVRTGVRGRGPLDVHFHHVFSSTECRRDASLEGPSPTRSVVLQRPQNGVVLVGPSRGGSRRHRQMRAWQGPCNDARRFWLSEVDGELRGVHKLLLGIRVGLHGVELKAGVHHKIVRIGDHARCARCPLWRRRDGVYVVMAVHCDRVRSGGHLWGKARYLRPAGRAVRRVVLAQDPAHAHLR